MIPGLATLRRAVTLGLCAGSFWAGMEFANWSTREACLDAGGRPDERGFCDGGRP
ncbi:MAG: DUF4094 domain-containing protein [Paracoccaceae bacterium]